MAESEIRLAIVGSRYYTDEDDFTKHVEDWIESNGSPGVIVSGGAKGADSLAQKYAENNNLPLVEFLPNLKEFGKKGYLIRNSQIVDASTHVLAFPCQDSRGTWDTVKKAGKKGIDVTVVRVKT